MLLNGNISIKKLIVTDNKITFSISNFFMNFKFLKEKTRNKNPIKNMVNNPTIPVEVKI